MHVSNWYVDAFCGRVRGSVLARNYSDFTPTKLRAVYEGARLRVPSAPRASRRARAPRRGAFYRAQGGKSPRRGPPPTGDTHTAVHLTRVACG